MFLGIYLHIDIGRTNSLVLGMVFIHAMVELVVEGKKNVVVRYWGWLAWWSTLRYKCAVSHQKLYYSILRWTDLSSAKSYTMHLYKTRTSYYCRLHGADWAPECSSCKYFLLLSESFVEKITFDCFSTWTALSNIIFNFAVGIYNHLARISISQYGLELAINGTNSLLVMQVKTTFYSYRRALFMNKCSGLDIILYMSYISLPWPRDSWTWQIHVVLIDILNE